MFITGSIPTAVLQAKCALRFQDNALSSNETQSENSKFKEVIIK